ncbi:hypothetical protein DMA12_12215 [Amycolatopsis balhimycina DSM 5908]|uniref:Secreted protein n=1 Tax=Amycolatopsis balhimycina DSM 5908 TaxID=1081091 RepID=A0A428WSJ0_AMYBA|nr:hypothetical protein [Amycolatopsis balhimycina]RSM46043.1 hypothetical protein DMA12_12215 [Amycolatopsis balhimycina DSM 5908]
MRRLNRIFLSTAAVAVITAATTSIAVVPAHGAAAADEPPPVVEDYSYPGADVIFANDLVQLISGDGHILYKPCPAAEAPGLIIVRSNDLIGSRRNGRVCFEVTGAVGHLTLKIPNVYAVRGDGTTTTAGHKLRAELTTNAGAHSSVDVDPNFDTEVGIAATPPGDPTTLLQLDASR